MKKKWKIKLKAGSLSNTFKITPCLQITYSQFNLETGFGIELSWGRWEVGCRFYY